MSEPPSSLKRKLQVPRANPKKLLICSKFIIVQEVSCVDTDGPFKAKLVLCLLIGVLNSRRTYLYVTLGRMYNLVFDDSTPN